MQMAEMRPPMCTPVYSIERLRSCSIVFCTNSMACRQVMHHAGCPRGGWAAQKGLERVGRSWNERFALWKIARANRDAIRTKAMDPKRVAHNNGQAEYFNGIVDVFMRPVPEEVAKRHRTITSTVSGLPGDARIIDVGSGVGCLIPHMLELGLSDILAVDLSTAMLSELKKRFASPGILGNDLGVRTWCGDIIDLPHYMGPVDAIFMDGVFGNFYSQDATLLHCALMLRPGGKIVISHTLGRAWHTKFHEARPELVPHCLPDQNTLETMIHGLPLEVSKWMDQQGLYLAVLEVPPFFSFKGSPVLLEGSVVVGMGRGSKEMGVPTANLDPQPLQDQLKELPKGVYFGWAQLESGPSFPEEDSTVHPMVMNVGERPTLEDDRGVTVEAHIMHNYNRDFHGHRLKLLVLGFLRPEIKFSGLDALINRIQMDIGLSKSQLKSPELGKFQDDPFFS